MNMFAKAILCALYLATVAGIGFAYATIRQSMS